MKTKVPGQVSLGKLQGVVIAFVVIGVAGTVGLNIMGSVQDTMTVSGEVANETFNATSSTFNVTVAEASDGDFEELTSVQVFESEQQDSELSASIVDAEAGKVEVSSTVDQDLESLSYRFEDADTETRAGADQAIQGMNEVLGFLPVIGLVVAAAVVIGLVSGFGSSMGRRGRA